MFEQTISASARAEIQRIGELVRQRDDAWAVPRESGEFLHTLVLAGGYRRGIEVGTSYGYSGLWIGSALLHNGGEFVTIEVNAEKVEHARDVFRRAGFGQGARVVHGVADDLLAEIHGPFDFVFIDADKENSLRYFERLWPKLAHRSTIVTDNVISHKEQMQPFVEHIQRHPHLFSTIVTIGSGLLVSVKVRPHQDMMSIDGADWVI